MPTSRTAPTETEHSDLLLIVIMALAFTVLYHLASAALNLHQQRLSSTQPQLPLLPDPPAHPPSSFPSN